MIIVAQEYFGGLAQLGERYNGIVEVIGSSPLSSTFSRTWKGHQLLTLLAFFHCRVFPAVLR